MTPSILIVDDEPDLVGACERLLRRVGWRVATAATHREAMAAMAASPYPRLAVVDRQMDEGHALAISGRARRTGIPVLVISGFGSATTRRLMLDEGAAGFLAKPFSAREFLTVVQSIVGDPPRPETMLPPPDAGGFDGFRPGLHR